MKNGFLTLLRHKWSQGMPSGRRGSRTKFAAFIMAFAVIFIIAGAMVFSTFKMTKRNTACLDLLTINDAVELFELDNHSLPDDLQTLWNPAEEESKVYLKWRPIDPWGNPYVYHVNDVFGYELKSLGADGKVGGEGDAEDITAEDAKMEIHQQPNP